MVGEARLIGPPHDLADRARRARPARQTRHISACDDPARRNPSKHMQHSAGKDGLRCSSRHDEPYSKTCA